MVIGRIIVLIILGLAAIWFGWRACPPLKKI